MAMRIEYTKIPWKDVIFGRRRHDHNLHECLYLLNRSLSLTFSNTHALGEVFWR
jgi:hypothetical protein